MLPTHLGKLVYYAPRGFQAELYGICGRNTPIHVITCLFFNGLHHDFIIGDEELLTFSFHITHSDDISIYIEPRYQ